MRSFVALAFDETGDVLVSMGADNKHTATLWAWRNKRDQAPLARVPTIQGVVPAVWGVTVNPYAHVSAKHGPRDGSPDPSKSGEFLTFGDKHLKVWRKDKTSGIWGGKLASFSDTKAFGVNSAVYLPVKGEGKSPRVLAGTSDGRLAIFDLGANKLVKLIRAHEDLGRAPSMRQPAVANTKGIRALLLLEEDNVVVTGGADGRVITWALTEDGDDVVGKIDEIALRSPAGPEAPPPMIDPSPSPPSPSPAPGMRRVHRATGPRAARESPPRLARRRRGGHKTRRGREPAPLNFTSARMGATFGR
jgi:microtubule-associated protein-like 6